MIIDVYTHIWESTAQWGNVADGIISRATELRDAATREPHEDPGHDVCAASAVHHWNATSRADCVIVCGFKSELLNADIPNNYVADAVRQHPEKLIGFAGLDPANPECALREIEEAQQVLGLKGVAIAPAAQGFHPSSSGAYKVYEALEAAGLPMIVHCGMYLTPPARLEYARPVLLDEVARDFPSLRMVVAHLGAPWTDETIALLGKHANVFAEVSGLITQPWQAYNGLVSAYQAGTLDKLLFGSGFPISSSERALELLYRVTRVCQASNLPTIPRELLRSIAERPSLQLLGIEDAAPAEPSPAPAMMVADPDA